jgi:hypothetical protein
MMATIRAKETACMTNFVEGSVLCRIRVDWTFDGSHANHRLKAFGNQKMSLGPLSRGCPSGINMNFCNPFKKTTSDTKVTLLERTEKGDCFMIRLLLGRGLGHLFTTFAGKFSEKLNARSTVSVPHSAFTF